MSTPIKVDIWSDVACPWCYIGKRKFEAGAGLFAGGGGGRAVEVEYHSFELAPDTPVDFEGSELDYLAERKGMPADKVAQMLERVAGIARQVGLDYDFPAVQHTNTVKAHQALHFAKAHGKQTQLKERLLKAYFVEGGHVGHIDDLVRYGSEVGLDADALRRSLESDEYLAAVHDDQTTAGEYGIQGVPFFVIDGTYGVSGAQEAATFVDVLNQVWQERASVDEPAADEPATEAAK